MLNRREFLGATMGLPAVVAMVNGGDEKILPAKDVFIPGEPIKTNYLEWFVPIYAGSLPGPMDFPLDFQLNGPGAIWLEQGGGCPAGKNCDYIRVPQVEIDEEGDNPSELIARSMSKLEEYALLLMRVATQRHDCRAFRMVDGKEDYFVMPVWTPPVVRFHYSKYYFHAKFGLAILDTSAVKPILIEG